MEFGIPCLRLFLSIVLCLMSTSVQSETCPRSCSCSLVPNETLSIECSQRLDVTLMVNDLLANNSCLESLTVTGSAMKIIPKTVCELLQLKNLTLVNNSLEILDPDCFANLTKLVSVYLMRNRLTEIPNHTFDSNQLLKAVDFTMNNISFIGLHVFSNASILNSLECISFRHNTLTSLEPWPIIRMNVRRTNIDLRYNLIENLTDELNWSYNCDMGAVRGQIDIRDNRLHRFTELQFGWKFPTFFDVICIFSKSKDTEFQIYDNQYHCDCIEYRWIKLSHTWASASRNIGQVRCHSPIFLGLPLHPLTKTIPLDRLTCTKSWFAGKCTCIEIPENRKYKVQCHHYASVPEELPKPYWNFSYGFSLEYSGNQIDYLPARAYMVNVTILDVSNNHISRLDPLVLRLLQKATEIKLNDNRLTRLPPEVINITEFNGKISLHNNPWDCSCQYIWLQQWMHHLNTSLSTPSAVLCASPEWLNGSNLLNADFCAKDPQTQQRQLIALSVGSILSALFLLVSILIVLYKARVWIFTSFNVRIFNDWDDNVAGRYDAFMSFAYEDYTEVQTIVDSLEEEQGFVCCIHNRDFNLGQRIIDQMGACMNASRRVLCFLSPNFLRSNYCIWEFTHALEGDVQRGKKRLAVIMVEPATEFDESNQVVQQYISRFTYLEVNDPDFMKKLLYIMPSTNRQHVNGAGDEMREFDDSENDSEAVANEEEQLLPELSHNSHF